MSLIILEINVFEITMFANGEIVFEFRSEEYPNHIVFRNIDQFSRTIYWELRRRMLSNANINDFTKLL